MRRVPDGKEKKKKGGRTKPEDRTPENVKSMVALSEITGGETPPEDASIAEKLGCELGYPVMWVQRLTFDKLGKPIDFEYLAFRGDTYKYQFQIDRL